MDAMMLTPDAAQAAHWFDWGKLWPEAARVLKPGGSLASWVCTLPPTSPPRTH